MARVSALVRFGRFSHCLYAFRIVMWRASFSDPACVLPPRCLPPRSLVVYNFHPRAGTEDKYVKWDSCRQAIAERSTEAALRAAGQALMAKCSGSEAEEGPSVWAYVGLAVLALVVLGLLLWAVYHVGVRRGRSLQAAAGPVQFQVAQEAVDLDLPPAYEDLNVPIPVRSVRSKEGTLPFAELNGIEYPDSSFAIRDLTRILGKEHLEKNFSPQQTGASRAIEKMIEASALLSYAYVRYAEKWNEMAAEFSKYDDFNNIFFRSIFYIFAPFLKSRIKKIFFIMGMGKHPREEILNIGFDDLRALSQYLGDNKFIMGDQATKVDAAVFGTLAQIIYLPVHTPHLDMIKAECTNLVEYAERVKSEYWPDWDEACGKKLLNTDWKSFKKQK